MKKENKGKRGKIIKKEKREKKEEEEEINEEAWLGRGLCESCRCRVRESSDPRGAGRTEDPHASTPTCTQTTPQAVPKVPG